jgi:hypothetical protein
MAWSLTYFEKSGFGSDLNHDSEHRDGHYPEQLAKPSAIEEPRSAPGSDRYCADAVCSSGRLLSHPPPSAL